MHLSGPDEQQLQAAQRAAAPSPARPSGTVTFLFTDVEGSTALWEMVPAAMQTALARHDALLQQAVAAAEGTVFKTVGDAFCVAFATPHQALGAALAAQRALAAAAWDPAIGALRVRMGLHTGAAEERDGDYFGPAVNRVARLMSAGHGGQILLSQATQELVRDTLPAGVTLRDLGRHRLKDLIHPEEIFQVVAADLPADFAALKTLDSRPHNLPRQTTALIGREQEVAAVRALLGDPRTALVTLTGPGGTGKTRLGLQVAAELLDGFAEGVWFVDLAPLRDPALVLATVATTLGVQAVDARPVAEVLGHFLRDKQLLLILDNFEQVVEAAAPVGALLAGARQVQALVTSRVPLQLQGERAFPVPPLALPDLAALPPPAQLSAYAAVRLFIARAQDVQPGFAVTPANAPAVAAICARLDGLPLAIELAAARIRLLPPGALLARLERRLSLLTGGARDRPARQQTLRGAIAWSYDLLDPEAQQLFVRLAVFAGGATLEAIEAVCNAAGDLPGTVLDGVDALVRQSLLRAEADTADSPRFGMLETIREYAEERLAERGEAATLRGQHAAYYRRLAETAEPQLEGPEQVGWIDRLEQEHANLRAALAWSEAAGQGEDGLRLAGALGQFWIVRGHWREGREHYARLLAGPSAPRNSSRAKALYYAGYLAWRESDRAAARTALEESLAIAQEVGDPQRRAAALDMLSRVVELGGDLPRAERFAEQSLAAARQAGDKATLAAAFYRLGYLAHFFARDPAGDRGQALYQQALALRRELGDRRGIALILANLGTLAADQGDLANARQLAEESLALWREVRDPWGISMILGDLGGVALEQEDYAAAHLFLAQSLALAKEAGIKDLIASALNNFGHLAINEGEDVAAWARFEAALAVAREAGFDGYIAEALCGLGQLAAQQGAVAQARTFFHESLLLCQKLGISPGLAEGLSGVAGLAVAQGAWPRAVELLSVVERLLTASQQRLNRWEQQQLDRHVAATRAQLDAAAWDAAWDAGQILPIAQAIAQAQPSPG